MGAEAEQNSKAQVCRLLFYPRTQNPIWKTEAKTKRWEKGKRLHLGLSVRRTAEMAGFASLLECEPAGGALPPMLLQVVEFVCVGGLEHRSSATRRPGEIKSYTTLRQLLLHVVAAVTHTLTLLAAACWCHHGSVKIAVPKCSLAESMSVF
ncbi:hypothetical protein PR202_gb27224 [Eleusine coracana subsp. coracana]|uniref:Uncharacterized protein n=1 Tax=Eleusine coracana subsp. coracana TaxID=191504 RepID=A0AAV5FR96_ELECO|nr:hypothetical protein PR202_gb27224 [Eleusine coracana subsp. coracana]